MGSLQAPVLPCFATCDEIGRLRIEIHPATAPKRRDIMQSFGALYASPRARISGMP